MSDIDSCLREQITHLLEPGDAVLSWVAVAGVRRMDGGGYTITLSSPDIPPWWQLRGMLAEASHNLDRTELFDALGIPDEADEDRE